jgi:hypothetical protein
MSLTPQPQDNALHQAIQRITDATPPLLDALAGLSAAELAKLYEQEVKREEAEERDEQARP